MGGTTSYLMHIYAHSQTEHKVPLLVQGIHLSGLLYGTQNFREAFMTTTKKNILQFVTQSGCYISL